MIPHLARAEKCFFFVSAPGEFRGGRRRPGGHEGGRASESRRGRGRRRSIRGISRVARGRGRNLPQPRGGRMLQMCNKFAAPTRGNLRVGGLPSVRRASGRRSGRCRRGGDKRGAWQHRGTFRVVGRGALHCCFFGLVLDIFEGFMTTPFILDFTRLVILTGIGSRLG